jgi:hypothetical protein
MTLNFTPYGCWQKLSDVYGERKSQIIQHVTNGESIPPEIAMDAPLFASYCDKKASAFLQEAAGQLSKLDAKFQDFFLTITQSFLTCKPQKAPDVREGLTVIRHPVPAPLAKKKRPKSNKTKKVRHLTDQMETMTISTPQQENSMEVVTSGEMEDAASVVSDPTYVSQLQVRAARCNGVTFNLYHRKLTPHIVQEIKNAFPTVVSRENEVSPMQYRDEMGLHTFECEVCAFIAQQGLFRSDGGRGRLLKNLVTLHLLSDFDEKITFEELHKRLFLSIGSATVTDEILAKSLKDLEM